MAEPLPDLQLVSLDLCVLHESVDPQRIRRLSAAIARDDVLRNPPIVARNGDHLMVLDGATRITALRQLGYAAAPVQIVRYTDDTITLQSWAHLLHGVAIGSLLRGLRAIEGLHVEPVDPQMAQERVDAHALIGALLLPDGSAWGLIGGTGLRHEAHLLDQVYHAYARIVPVQRLPHDEYLAATQVPDGTIVMIFPRYTKHDLLALTRAGGTLPAGITRHRIPGRVLRLNVPLAPLRDRVLEAQQAWFAAWVAERIAAGHARFYSEPTWLFDE